MLWKTLFISFVHNVQETISCSLNFPSLIFISTKFLLFLLSTWLNIFSLPRIIYWLYKREGIFGRTVASENAGDRKKLESHLSDRTKSRRWAGLPRGSLQGSSIVSIPGFLPSFSFKNKTRGAVDNACRCATVIIKSSKDARAGNLNSHERRAPRTPRVVVVDVLVAVSRLLPVFSVKMHFREAVSPTLRACFSQGRETMHGTRRQETASGAEGGGNLLCPRTNFSALFPEARYFKRHRMISESQCVQICKSDLNPGICGMIDCNQVFIFDNRHRKKN